MVFGGLYRNRVVEAHTISPVFKPAFRVQVDGRDEAGEALVFQQRSKSLI